MKNDISLHINSLRIFRSFWVFLFLSFFFWLFPFILRLFFIDGVEIGNNPNVKNLNVVSDITYHLLKDDRWSVFCLIFCNNLKVCIINIVGGTILGIVTFANLFANGFLAADTFATIHNHGMEINKILKYTLPHCFELIGIWVSGAIGFSIAKIIIDTMRGKEFPTICFYRFIGKCFLFIVLIIICAAFVETYVSIPYNK